MILIDSSLIQPFCDALGAVNPHRKPFIACFFVLYYVMGQLIVLNVVVAFILEAFMEAQATEASVEQGKGGTGEGSRDDGGDETETDRGTASLPLSGADDGQRPPPQQMKALPVAPDGDAGVV